MIATSFNGLIGRIYPSNLCHYNRNRRIKLKTENLKMQLQVKAMAESLLTEKLAKKIEECVILKAKLEEAEAQKNWVKKFVVVVCIGAFAARVFSVRC